MIDQIDHAVVKCIQDLSRHKTQQVFSDCPANRPMRLVWVLVESDMYIAGLADEAVDLAAPRPKRLHMLRNGDNGGNLPQHSGTSGNIITTHDLIACFRQTHW